MQRVFASDLVCVFSGVRPESPVVRSLPRCVPTSADFWTVLSWLFQYLYLLFSYLSLSDLFLQLGSFTFI